MAVRHTILKIYSGKKDNYNQAKIDRHVAYIDNKLEEYNRALAENDGDKRQLISDEIAMHQKREKRQTALKKHICRILRKEPNKL
jgi:type IV secretory pathway VirJ component